MELFREDGHLTDQALEALVSGRELNELDRLEMSEHLAFCDLCLSRYTQQLVDEGLMTPAHSCRDTIWWRIRQRAARLLASRWATAAAAIVLVVSLWNFGVFGGIADLSAYNNLMVSAPEIKGLWDFTVVPGTRQEDGTVNHAVASSGTACMLFTSCSQPDLAWEVLDWWTSAETQTRFGSEMESLLGASARYATANRESFSQLAWSVKEYNTIEAQRAYAQGVPEVPGGYFTSRHIDNAFRRVTYYWEDPKDTLTDYVYTINQEITGKRKEFGLPYVDQTRGGETP